MSKNDCGCVSKEKAEALLRFVVAMGEKEGIKAVENLSQLGYCHVPMLLAYMGFILNCLTKSSTKLLEVYEMAKELLVRKYRKLELHLNEEMAAEGDDFEICKFLVALLNEVRFSNRKIFERDYEIDNRHSTVIVNIWKQLDESGAFYEDVSWTLILKERRPVPQTPRSSRGRSAFPLGSTQQSPISESVSTPLARANFKLREYDRKYSELLERNARKELDYDDLEKESYEQKETIKKLEAKIESFSSKNGELMKLRMGNDKLIEQMTFLERQLKDEKSRVEEMKERLSFKEENVRSLQRRYDRLQEDYEQSQTRLQEKCGLVTRLRKDVETFETENELLREEKTHLENGITEVKETFQTKMSDEQKARSEDRKIAREKYEKLEEAFLLSNNRAHELSAKVSEIERQSEKWKLEVIRVKKCFTESESVCNGMRVAFEKMFNELKAKEGLLVTCNKALEKKGESLAQGNAVLQAENVDLRIKLEAKIEKATCLSEDSHKKKVEMVDASTSTCPTVKSENSLSESELKCSHDLYPLPLPDDEDDCLESKSVCASSFEVRTPAHTLSRGSDVFASHSTFLNSDDSYSSITSDRIAELQKRNMFSLPHMRTVAIPEVWNKFSNIDENDFRNSTRFEPPATFIKKKKSGLQKMRRNIFGISDNKKRPLKEMN